MTRLILTLLHARNANNDVAVICAVILPNKNYSVEPWSSDYGRRCKLWEVVVSNPGTVYLLDGYDIFSLWFFVKIVFVCLKRPKNENTGRGWPIFNKNYSAGMVYIWKTGVASNCAKALWDEVLYLPNCQTNLVIVLRALSLLFWHFINTTAYHLGRYKPSTPCTNELHGKSYWRFDRRPVELFIALWSC